MRVIKSHFKSARLQSVLITSYLLIILPVLLIVFGFINYFISSYQNDLIRFNAHFSNEFKMSMEYSIKEIMSSAQVLCSNTECKTILSKPVNRSQLEIFHDKNAIKKSTVNIIYHDTVSGVYLYTNDGQYYFSNCNIGTYDVSQNLQNNAWLQSIKPTAGKFEFIGLHNPEQLQKGSPVFSLVKQLTDLNYHDIGLLLIDIRLDLFENIVVDSDESPHHTYGVIDTANDLIYSSNNNYFSVLLDSQEYVDQLQTDSGHFPFQINGTTYLASFCTSSLTGWKVVSILPMETAVDRAIMARNILIFVILLSVFLAIVCAIVFSRQISSPILKLNHQMLRVSNGDFDVSCIPEGTKETVTLAKVFNTMVVHIRNLLRNEYQLKILRQQAEFKALQNQINPHFLYNTLETIGTLADLKDVPQVGETCRTLSNMFRYSISTSQDTTLLRNEIHHLEDYIQIIKLRFEDRITFHIEMDEDLNDYVILKLLLQPLAENAVNHGLANSLEHVIVRFKIEKDHDLIRVLVSDNGAGLSAERLSALKNTLLQSIESETNIWLDSGDHIGLRNIHMRLAYYYGKEYGVTDIQSSPGKGFSLQISFPAKKHTRRHQEC